ncbi:hypothetical protein [Botrimarina mediterranea]|uniref:hypothetical protein n=1 Tax=Botrimarina mediterranea TaxID=2528022 RepID=UPI003AF3197F
MRPQRIEGWRRRHSVFPRNKAAAEEQTSVVIEEEAMPGRRGIEPFRLDSAAVDEERVPDVVVEPVPQFILGPLMGLADRTIEDERRLCRHTCRLGDAQHMIKDVAAASTARMDEDEKVLAITVVVDPGPARPASFRRRDRERRQQADERQANKSGTPLD